MYTTTNLMALTTVGSEDCLILFYIPVIDERGVVEGIVSRYVEHGWGRGKDLRRLW